VTEHLGTDAKGVLELLVSQHGIEIKANTLLRATGSQNNGQPIKLCAAESLTACSELLLWMIRWIELNG
jgi:hypothetical protein